MNLRESVRPTVPLGVDGCGLMGREYAALSQRIFGGRIVADLAGEIVAAANAGEKTKTLKRIAAEHLAGEGGRAKVEGWVPRWTPPSVGAY